jgi:hypothetical protein
MPEQPWKATERRVAELLGGRRRPINGRGLEADIEHSMFAVEVKRLTAHFQWLDKAFAQAEQAATIGPRKIPMVVLHYSGTQAGASAYVVLRMPGFQELMDRRIPSVGEVLT